MKKSWEEKREKVESLTKSMDEAIEQYFETPEQLKEYLSFMSRFYQYSPHNVSLINEQFQGAKAVGSFKFWKEKGYSVKKGERGIEVLVPNKTVPKFKDVNGKWKSIKYATKEEKEKIQNGELEQRKGKLYFSVGHVFDISQTTAKASDLPKIFPNRWMEGNVDDYDAMIKALHKVAKKVDVTVGRPIGELGAAKGAFYYAVEKEGKGHIGLNPRNSELQNVKTLIHELAHAKLHHMKHENHHKLDDVEKEFQAEMTAYAVASYFGVDTSDYSLSYLANWTKGKEMKDKSTLLKEVHETSVEFIETMEEVLVKEREKEGEKELESNEKSLEKPVLVTSKKGQQIMRDLEPLGMFYYQEKNGDYVGIDNTDGEAFVEQFEDFGTCQKWLTNQNFEYYTELNYGKGKERLHWYETSRPISHGTQPTGFVEWDEEKGKYGLVAYKQPLTQQELEKFKMKPLKEEKEQMKVGEKEKGEQERE